MQSYTSHDTSNTGNWEIGWQQWDSQGKSLVPKLRLSHDETGLIDIQITSAIAERKVDERQLLILQKLLLQKPPELWVTNLGGRTESSPLDPSPVQVKDGHEDDGQQPTIH